MLKRTALLSLCLVLSLNPLFVMPAAQAASAGQLIAPKAPVDVALPPASGLDNGKILELPNHYQDARNQKILSSLVSQAGWFQQIKIEVTDGMVTITGRAKDKTQLEWLAKTADRLPSVIAVINKAEIEQPPLSDFSPAFHELRSLVERAKRGLPAFALIIILLTAFFFLGRLINRWVESLWRRRISNPFLLSTVSKMTMLPIWLIFFYFSLQIAGLSSAAATIVGGTGVVGLVIGFAFKDIAENYLSGLLLAFRSPFTKGDLIRITNYLGYVQGLEMRGTTIIDLDGNLILIPNTIVIQSVIENLTATPSSRLSFTINIGYGDSIAKAQDLVEECLRQIPDVEQKPTPLVVVDQAGNGTVMLKIFFWYNAKKVNSLAVKSTAIAHVKDTLIANKIGLAADGLTHIVFGDTLNVHQISDRQDMDAELKKKQDQKAAEAALNLESNREQQRDRRQAHVAEVQQLVALADQAPQAPPRDNLLPAK